MSCMYLACHTSFCKLNYYGYSPFSQVREHIYVPSVLAAAKRSMSVCVYALKLSSLVRLVMRSTDFENLLLQAASA